MSCVTITADLATLGERKMERAPHSHPEEILEPNL